MPQELIERRIGRGRSVTVNIAESPLGWLASRGLVTGRQLAAGEQLRSDYERAQLAASVTMSWNAAATTSTKGGRAAPDAPDRTAAQLDAKRRFDAALAAAGPGLADVLWRVVCACEKLPDAERALGWPARSGRVVLAIALDRVAGYYRLG